MMGLDHIWLFGIGGILALFAVLLHYKNYEKAAILVLFLAALSIRFFMVYLDPFLHDWDERFHAQVARNMMYNPFVPVLKPDPVIPYNYTAWCCNHVWVHKQPLFMWQMALSMKIFGISEFAIRYPSAIMGALTTLLAYRIADLLTKNKTIAFTSAFLLCFSHYQLEFISGYAGMDHNDMAFCFYVLASIWAYTEYIRSPKLYWVLLIGLLAGCAILNKWLTGLVVFSAWGLNILLSIRNKETKREIGHLLIAILVAVVVFLPWQLYILHTFPKEAAFEFEFNARHLTEVVESATSGIWFYVDHRELYFGENFWIPVVFGLLVIPFSRSFDRKTGTTILTVFLVLFVFFSFVVKSKVESFFFVMLPLAFVFMAVAFGKLAGWMRLPKLIYLCCTWFCAYHLLAFGKIREKHSPGNLYRQAKVYNTKLYKTFRSYVPDSIKQVMNLTEFNDVEIMFYNPGLTAYHYCFNATDMEFVRAKNVPIATFKTRNGYINSWEAEHYEKIFIIDKELRN